jgi:hypothetical protein
MLKSKQDEVPADYLFVEGHASGIECRRSNRGSAAASKG